MTKWMPNEQMTRAKIRQWREQGMQPEMIGFRIGWDWGHARVLDKHSQVMLEMAQLHEQEKQAMLAAWNAQHQIVVMHLRTAAALKPYAMTSFIGLGFLIGIVIGVMT